MDLQFLKEAHTTLFIEEWVRSIQTFFQKSELDKMIDEITKNNS